MRRCGTDETGSDDNIHNLLGSGVCESNAKIVTLVSRSGDACGVKRPLIFPDPRRKWVDRLARGSDTGNRTLATNRPVQISDELPPSFSMIPALSRRVGFCNTMGISLSVNYMINSYHDISGDAIVTVILVRNTMPFTVSYG